MQPTAKIDCPNCGSKIPMTAKFHYDNGRICILDWEGAWLAGAVKKEDVPEPKRWWKEKEEYTLDVMTKDELKEFGENLGIDIDMRMSKENILAHIKASGKI